MGIGLMISGLALGVSIVSATFVYWQIQKQTNATKAQLFTTIIDDIHQDSEIQLILDHIFNSNIISCDDNITGKRRIKTIDTKSDITPKVDKLLGRLQVVGHLYSLKVLKKRNLQTIHYEIIITGRNLAIRKYFQYLNTDYIVRTGVEHDHYEYFKKLYYKFEYDKRQRKQFLKCFFKKSYIGKQIKIRKKLGVISLSNK